MARSRAPSRSSILFPWEGRTGFVRFLRAHRVRPIVVLVLAVVLFGAIASRERQRSGIRQTRATLLAIRPAVDAYLAENDGACPDELERVLDYSAFRQLPVDAWGRPFRLLCPGRREGERYELSSDGPDGEPGGLDRIE